MRSLKRNFPRCFAVAAFTLVGAGVLLAQEGPRLTLAVKETVVIPSQAAAPLLLPVKCDPAGNLFFRRYQVINTLGAPVTKIAPDGKRTVVYDINSVPGFQGKKFDDFGIGFRGEVYMLAFRSKDELAVVEFDQDGMYRSKTRLSPLFQPAHFVPLASGQFLVSGTKLSEENQQPTGKPFTAIYGGDGELVRELTLPGDSESATAGDAPLNRAVVLGTLAVAEDGNIYLLRASDRPLVHVISPAAVILRILVITPPLPNSRPITMKVAGGRVVVMFEQDNPTGEMAEQVFSVVNAETGEKLADYWSPPEIGGAFACYTPDRFTFIGVTSDHHLKILHAVPR